MADSKKDSHSTIAFCRFTFLRLFSKPIFSEIIPTLAFGGLLYKGYGTFADEDDRKASYMFLFFASIGQFLIGIRASLLGLGAIAFAIMHMMIIVSLNLASKSVPLKTDPGPDSEYEIDTEPDPLYGDPDPRPPKKTEPKPF